jgi:hypothetical protein
MRSCHVAEIQIDQHGRLLVIPVDFDPRRQFIYRTATGVLWEETSNAFVAAAPEKWQHGEFLTHMLHEVQGELGECLRVTDQTRWVNVAPEVERELSSIFREQK